MSALDNEDSDDEIFGVDMSSLADAMSSAAKNDELEEQAASQKSQTISTICDCFLKGITSGESESFNQCIQNVEDDIKIEVNELELSFKAIQSGSYVDLISGARAQQLFAATTSPDMEPLNELRSRVITLISTGEEETALFRILDLVSIAVAAFNMFLQINYTGPEVEEKDIPSIPMIDLSDNRDNAATLLSVDGEIPYNGSDGTSLLVVARVILGLLCDPTVALWTIPVAMNEGNNNDSSIAEGNDIWKCCEADQRPREKVALSLVMACKQLRGYTAWWSARAIVTHQRLFIAGATSTTLWTEFCHCFRQVLSWHCYSIDPKASMISNKDSLSQLCAEVWLEFGLAMFHFEKSDMGKSAFEAARKAASLHVEMTGAMGKRTKFQQRSIAQMMIKATTIRSSDSGTATGGSAVDGEGTKPHTEEQASDSILFEHTQYDADEDKLEGEEALIGEQLSVLLALCLDVKNSNPKDGLTTEEMRPYIERVLIHHFNWTIYSTGLLQRAWLDFESTYARDRATLQLQALVDQHGKTLTYTQLSRDVIEASAGVVERLRFLHSVVYPPRWELRKDLATKYQELGILVSASELFINLELWDDVVECYSRMGRRKDALAVVQEQRDKGSPPTPRMLCSIGDLLEAPESTHHYEEAWELSGGRYAKAMRSAGREAVQLADAALAKEADVRSKLSNPSLAAMESVSEEIAATHASDAVSYLEYAEVCLGKSLGVQPSVTSDWFVLGTVRMRLTKWQLALTCFSTVVSHEPDAGDAWGNVGAIHMRLKRPDLALAAFTEGLKASRESWRMWENRLLSGLQIKPSPPAPDVVLSTWELLNLQDRGLGRGVDTAMLAAVVSSVLRYEGIDVGAAERGEPQEALALDEEPFTSDYFSTKHIVKKTGNILERSTSSNKATDPKAWELFAIFNVAVGRRSAARECRLKHCRQLQIPGWEKRVQDMHMIADAVKDLVQLYTLPLGPPSHKLASIGEESGDAASEGEGAAGGPTTEKTDLYNLSLFVKSIAKRATTALGSSGDPAREILEAAKEKVEAMVNAHQQ